MHLAWEKPHLIICDVEMPFFNGPDMALQIFLRDAGEELIPILLASVIADLHCMAEKTGAPSFLDKPFSVEPLLDTLRRARSERRPPQPKLETGR